MVIATCIPRLHFIGLKAKCDNGAREQGNLVYDQGRRELYVEIHSNGAAKRHGVEAALKMDGSDDLSLAFVDMFKAKPRDTNDGHVQTN